MKVNKFKMYPTIYTCYNHDHLYISISGFEDYGSLGKTTIPADNFLVFLVRSIHGRKWKLPFAYFFVKGAGYSSKLCELIKM